MVKLQSVIISMGEKPAIIRQEMANQPYGAAGVITDGVLTNGIRAKGHYFRRISKGKGKAYKWNQLN